MEKYNKFVKDIVKFYAKDNENMVISPLSIWLAAEMLADATGGETRKQIIEKLLGSESINVKGTKDLHIANAMFGQTELAESVKQSFVNMLKEKYSAGFITSDNTPVDVNRWVKKNTLGLIKEIMDPKSSAVFGIANAIAFKEKWANPFDVDEDETVVFKNSDGSKKKTVPLQSWESGFVENNSFEGFIKPYARDNKYVFMAILPKDKQKNLQDVYDGADFEELYTNISWDYDVVVKIPAFKAESSYEIKEFFESIGIKDVFIDKADFSGMSDLWLKADKITHKATIDVNENGTVATAATVVEVVCAGIPEFKEQKHLNFDRPFMYAIVDGESGLPVFEGVINKVEGMDVDDEVEPIFITDKKGYDDIVREIAKIEFASMDDEDKEYYLNHPDYYEHHFDYGMYLRNKYIHNKIEGAVIADNMSHHIFDKIIELLRKRAVIMTNKK